MEDGNKTTELPVQTKESAQNLGTSPGVPRKSNRFLGIQRTLAAPPTSSAPVQKKEKKRKPTQVPKETTTKSKPDDEAKVENQEKPGETEKAPDADGKVDDESSKKPKKQSHADPKTKPKRARTSRKAPQPEGQAAAQDASASSSATAPPVDEAAPKKRARRSKKVTETKEGEETDQPAGKAKADIPHSWLTDLGCSTIFQYVPVLSHETKEMKLKSFATNCILQSMVHLRSQSNTIHHLCLPGQWRDGPCRHARCVLETHC